MDTVMPSFVICGIEHSGTTLLSDIFRQAPDIDAGFEVGVLLAPSPREFRALEPFVSHLVSGWGVDEGDLDEICDCDSYETFYARLWERSTVVDHGKSKTFDKTPRYFSQLSTCVERLDRPFVVTYKDPRAIVASDFRRETPENFEEWFSTYAPGKKQYLRRIHEQLKRVREGELGSVIAVSLEALCLDTRRTLERVFAHVGERFDLSYLLLKGLRYENTRVPYISSSIAFEYMNMLSRSQQARVEKEFSVVDRFFYS